MMAKRITIVGLGLMGGSLALAIRPFVRHLAVVDIDQTTRTAAENLADLVTADLAEGIRHADLAILAAPVRTIMRHLEVLPRIRSDGCMVLDLGSTKSQISRSMDALPSTFSAIGGHPLCGKEVGGFSAASADLFHGHSFVLCRNERTDSLMEETAIGLIERIGARPIFLPAGLHDELVAVSSHIPYLAAALLIRSAHALNDSRVWQVSASGFRDTSRLAASDPRMMLDILATNQPAIMASLEKYQEELDRLTALLRSSDEAGLARWLEEVKRDHMTYLGDRDAGIEG